MKTPRTALTSSIAAAALALAAPLLGGCLSKQHFDRRSDELVSLLNPGEVALISPAKIKLTGLATQTHTRPGTFLRVMPSGEGVPIETRCEAILADSMRLETAFPDDDAPRTWREILPRLDDPAVVGPTGQLPDALLADVWLRVGVFFDAFDFSLSVGAPTFAFGGAASRVRVSFQAWRAKRLTELAYESDVDRLHSCCQTEGCGDYLVVTETEIDVYKYRYRNLSASANGRYTVYSGDAQTTSALGEQARERLYLLELRSVPAKAASLRDVCSLPSSLVIAESGRRTLKLPCPVAGLSFGEEDLTVAVDRDPAGYTLDIKPTGDAGTIGAVLIRKSGMPEVRLPVFVARKTAGAEEPTIDSDPPTFSPRGPPPPDRPVLTRGREGAGKLEVLRSLFGTN